MKYSKGDIVWVDFPFTDASQSKPRPAMIISNSRVNRTGDYLLIMITSKIKKDKLSIKIKDSDYRSTSLEIQSYTKPTQVFENLVIYELRIKNECTNEKGEFIRNSYIRKNSYS